MDLPSCDGSDLHSPQHPRRKDWRIWLVGSPPSVVNAVVDALHFKGVRHIDMPLTPEKIWRILNDLPPQSQP